MVASDGGGTSNGIAKLPQDEFREGGKATDKEPGACRIALKERYAELAEDSQSRGGPIDTLCPLRLSPRR